MHETAVDWETVRADAVALMSRYVQFNTTNPPGQEMAAAQWLCDQLLSRGITQDVTVHEPLPGRGLLVARIPGEQALKPLVVNHHLDVVAADPAQWTYPPFSGAVADGFVWGRGTLDTKSLGVMFLLALQRLVREGARFRRPVVFLAVPDEEAGSQGMRWFVERYAGEIDPQWVWDEGAGGNRGVFGPQVLYGIAVAEKQVYQVRLTASGDPGHGSMPHDNNATVTLLKAVDRVLSAPRPVRLTEITAGMFRAVAAGQKFPASLLLNNLGNPLVRRVAAGQLTANKMVNALLRDTVSLTVLRAGYKTNVIPESAEAELDCRLLPDTKAEEFHSWLVARIADPRVKVESIHMSAPSGVAPLSGPFYSAVAGAIARHVPGAGIFPLLMTGATDGHYWRERGYAAYGFSPAVLDPPDIGRIHGIDERISSDNLVLGVKMVYDVIRELCVEAR